MMELKKTQVGALLKVIGKDDSRPVLKNAFVDKWGDDTVLVATNGYILSVLHLDTEDAEPLVGRMVRREGLEKWYKLATGRSRLTTEELVSVSNEDFGHHGEYPRGEYPKWENVIPNGMPDGADELAFNAEFCKVLQDLDDSDGLTWTVHGKLQPMVATTEKGTYLMMPKRV